ncbi:MAG: hypothetical protein Q8O26_12050 [Phreatobacter sp.]|uniref:hypothetical protein n=1 Tax=Phreatobacter sp. TaxID=1966341 RepID=UPI002732C8C9|nr:hypothetical protein [Phreatobacter sp.]MDP2802605.1 hypothetical protein [Phreatobacter sp.]
MSRPSLSDTSLSKREKTFSSWVEDLLVVGHGVDGRLVIFGDAAAQGARQPFPVEDNLVIEC